MYMYRHRQKASCHLTDGCGNSLHLKYTKYLKMYSKILFYWWGKMVYTQRSAASQHTYVKFFVRVRRWFPHEDMHYFIHENKPKRAYIYVTRAQQCDSAGGDFQPRHRTNNAHQPGEKRSHVDGGEAKRIFCCASVSMRDRSR